MSTSNGRNSGRVSRSWWIGLAGAVLLIPMTSQAQQAELQATVGAYYFDGWSGQTSHITDLLKTEFANRKPVWGWKDDTVEIMQKQIDYCANHAIAFWSFCWYYPEGEDKTTPLNNALGLYLKAPNRQRLNFCLLVANHGGFRIGPKDWDACCEEWIELFQQPTHLRLDGLPLLIIFSPSELQQAFGGVEGVHEALASLRAKAKDSGLPGVAIAACTGPGGHLVDLARSGYTLVTGYNYSLGWQSGDGSQPFLPSRLAITFGRVCSQRRQLKERCVSQTRSTWATAVEPNSEIRVTNIRRWPRKMAASLMFSLLILDRSFVSRRSRFRHHLHRVLQRLGGFYVTDCMPIPPRPGKSA